MSGGSCGGLFVGGPTGLNTADTALFNLIQSLGYPMTYIDDNAITTTSWTGYGFAYVSDSASAPILSTTCLNWPIGIMWQVPNGYANMRMSNVAGVSNGSQTQIRVTAAGALHPTAAGFGPGVVTTASSASAYNSSATGATFGTGVVLIAEIVSNANRKTIFAYDTGSSMVGAFIAPARRIATHYRGSAGIVASLTAAGRSIFEASIRWIANNATRDCNGLCNGPSIRDCAGICYNPSLVSRPPNCVGCDGICRPCCDGKTFEDCSKTCKVCLSSGNKFATPEVVQKTVVILKLRPLNSRKKK